ncbi:carbon-nitrogen family hydrolase [Candidatus Margulisiibacteriota bacterium]
MPDKFNIAMIQMNIVPGAVEHNLRTALALMKKSLAAKPQVIVLPEMWSTDLLKTKDPLLANTTPQILNKLFVFAKNNSAYILGTLPELIENKLYNTMFIISPEGKVLDKYQKINLFKLTGEHTTYTAGNKKLILSTPLGKWGAAICFDIRFPNLIQELATNGMDVLFVSAQWPWERKEHWENLLRARAIENQIFVVGVNRVGKSNGLEYSGRSLVFDPWGDLLAEGSSGEEILSCELDLSKIKEVREKLPLA